MNAIPLLPGLFGSAGRETIDPPEFPTVPGDKLMGKRPLRRPSSDVDPVLPINPPSILNTPRLSSPTVWAHVHRKAA